MNSGDSSHHELACVTAKVVPNIGDSLDAFLAYFPLAILLLVGLATTGAALFSPWGSFNPLHFSSNFHRDEDLLRLMTPGFADCLFYIQYVVLAGSLSLDYPGYYQPIVANGAWSVLLFDYSFVSNKSFQSVRDGVYAIDFDAPYGLMRLSQLCGLGMVGDVWPGYIIWMLVVVVSGILLGEAMLAVHWLILRLSRHPSSAAKVGRYSMPYTLGNGIRIIFGYFLFPLTTFTLFQLVTASSSPTGSVVAAVLLFVGLLGLTGYVMARIRKRKPRSFLFDDFKSLLIFGPLYNTYTDTHDQHALFAWLEPTLNIIRGIACGAAQKSGIAQIALLAIVEIIHLLMIMAFRPFHPSTNTNAYHNVFTCIRFLTIILSIAFIPELHVPPAPKGVIGYIVLCIHAIVLIFGFFLNAFQTLAEILLRLCGVSEGPMDVESAGPKNSFGVRQISTRKSRFGVPRHQRGADGPYSSQAEMLMRAADQADGHSRSGSLGSRLFLNSADLSSSPHAHAYSLGGAATAVGTVDSRSTAMTPPYYYPSTVRTAGQNYRAAPLSRDLHSMSLSEKRYLTPAEYHNYVGSGGGGSVMASHRSASRNGNSIDLMNTSLDAADMTDFGADSIAHSQTASVGASASDSNAAGYMSVASNNHDYSSKPAAAAGGKRTGRLGSLKAPNHDEVSRPVRRTTDYAVREADFFYGPANNDAGARQADRPGAGANASAPTAAAAGVTAVATVASQWVKGLFGRGKVKEQHKGFEVVRNRPPPRAGWGPPPPAATAGKSNEKKPETTEEQVEEQSSKRGLVAGDAKNDDVDKTHTHIETTVPKSSPEEGLVAGIEGGSGIDDDPSLAEPYHDEPGNRTVSLNNHNNNTNNNNNNDYGGLGRNWSKSQVSSSTPASTLKAIRPNTAGSESTKRAAVRRETGDEGGRSDLLNGRPVTDFKAEAESSKPQQASPVSPTSYRTAAPSPITDNVSRQSSGTSQAPTIPRKSSKRESAVLREENAKAVQEALENMPKTKDT